MRKSVTEQPPTDLAALKARCPLVVDRPLATWLQRASLGAVAVAAPLAALGGDWPLAARLLAGAALLPGIALLVTLGRRACSAGSFRLAADAHALYLREESGEVRAFAWSRCGGVEACTARGERAVRFLFAREGGARWNPIRHARLFLTDASVEIVVGDVGRPAALVERLEALRAAAGGDARDEAAERRRAAA